MPKDTLSRVGVTESSPPGVCSLLVVNAHPDDESISTGLILSHYAGRGIRVTSVTCTLGEHAGLLRAGRTGEPTADVRYAELRRAMAALGVKDWRLLGGRGKYSDSGPPRVGHTPAGAEFSRADLGEASDDLVRVILEVRPQVVVTYDPAGGYGHPDHIMAHTVTMAAVKEAASATPVPWNVQKVYWIASPAGNAPRGWRRRRIALLRRLIPGAPAVQPPTPDSQITTRISSPEAGTAKAKALSFHASQLPRPKPWFTLGDITGFKDLAVEHFRLASGLAAPPFDSQGFETDLFNGVTGCTSSGVDHPTPDRVPPDD